MAPEQARGEVDVLDERADVFALGSILCEVLTGSPAFTGRTAGEIQRKAALGNTADALARLEAVGADAELIHLAGDCLAREREDRPRDANAVAGRISEYLAGVQERLKRSERERAVAEAHAVDERKRRKLQAALGLTFTSLVILCGTFAWWSQEQRRTRLARAEQATRLAEQDAVSRFDRARGADRDPALWAEAKATARKAAQQAIADGVPAEVRARIVGLISEIERLEKNRRLVATLLEIHASMGDQLTVGYDQDFAGTDERYGRAFADYGTDLFRLAPEQGADLLRKLGGEVRVELAAALDNWAYVRSYLNPGRDRHPLLLLTRLLDPDPLRNRIRDALISGDGPALRAIANEIDPSLHPAETTNLLSCFLWRDGEGPRYYEEAATLLQKAQPHHAGDFQISHNLAWHNVQLSRFDAALGYARAAVAIRPRSAAAWADLAHSLAGLGRDAEAIAAYRRVFALSPRTLLALDRVASILEKQGKTDEAAAERRKAAAERRKSIEPDLKSASLNSEQGGMLLSSGRIDEAIASFRKAIELAPKFAKAHGQLVVRQS
jgi:serine/threonine-protein kinase